MASALDRQLTFIVVASGQSHMGLHDSRPAAKKSFQAFLKMFQGSGVLLITSVLFLVQRVT